MNKKVITYSILTILVLFILFASFILIIGNSFENVNVILDKLSVVKIDNKEIKAIYKDGDEVDVSLTYGNIYTKEIKVVNKNDQDITYSIKFNDASISNELITYDAQVSYNDVDYTNVLTNKKVEVNGSLLHNLVVPKDESMSIRIIFKSNMENVDSIIKGRVEVTSNLTSLELFSLTINNIDEAIDNKVEDLNGISVKGYYILDINDISFNNDANVSGYVLIDSTDISDIKYVYTIYNNKYMIKNATLNNSIVVNVDDEYSKSLNKDNICYQFDTRIKCNTFNNIPKNPIDNKKVFYNNIKLVIDEYKNKEIYDDMNYVYTINQNDIVGYIIINKNDMFIYLRDSLFMVSGYNYKKLGDFDIKSKAIRTYNESAFSLAASDANKACEFSGLNNCFNGN